MSEIADFEAFHPRAVKLMRKRKNFIVIAEDEPYFMDAYFMIRACEKLDGRWSEEDEQAYRSAQYRVERAGLDSDAKIEAQANAAYKRAKSRFTPAANAEVG